MGCLGALLQGTVWEAPPLGIPKKHGEISSEIWGVCGRLILPQHSTAMTGWVKFTRVNLGTAAFLPLSAYLAPDTSEPASPAPSFFAPLLRWSSQECLSATIGYCEAKCEMKCSMWHPKENVATKVALL